MTDIINENMASVPELHIDGFIAAVPHTVVAGMSPVIKVESRKADCVMPEYLVFGLELQLVKPGEELEDPDNASHTTCQLLSLFVKVYLKLAVSSADLYKTGECLCHLCMCYCQSIHQ
ncbi:uncharacterized protein LOC134191445 [Corticium candelabrum]|uniref:uncharacterized protein LOC134191445 n=1 Tax=Corticium candelabrum TaxID=121492 RepID=UPI002E263304|nr:uncharacterized protein LOC134191445 [Corticium candelabrum]